MLPDLPPVLRPDLHRGHQDRELGLACVRAYNDWMVEEWCGDSRRPADPAVPHPAVGRRAGGRRDPAQRRPRGARRDLLRDPAPPRAAQHPLGYWDPFFAACAETGTVVNMHIGSSSKMPATSADAPVAVAATLSFGNAMASLADFLFSGVLIRFPDLRLAYSEGQIGWLPYILERADDVWREHRAWGGVRDTSSSRRPPTTTARCSAASSGTSTGSSRSTGSASTTSPSRPTTPTPTRPGPTPWPWPRR